MATEWNKDRWKNKGVTDAGDTVYERTVKAEKPAKKTTAKKAK